jgi:hypothetical protein
LRFRFRTVPHARSTLARAHLSFLRSHVRLIGRRDRTAIIDRSRCRVKEKSFLEAVSHGEAQLPLVPARLCSRRRKKAVLLCPVTLQVRFARVVRAIASNKKATGLASNERK